MGIFFAKKKPASRVTEHDKAVLQLKQTRDKIKQYQRRIEQSKEKERELLKKLIQNDQRERAKLLLKRRKKFRDYDQILETSDNQLENLERMVHDLEFAQVEMKVVDGLKIGNAALKSLHEVLKIEDIEKVMDDTREGIEKQRELDELLSGEFSEEDERDITAELEDLLAKNVEESMPDVPVSSVPTEVIEEEEEEKEKVKVTKKEKAREPVALEA
ncbi:charged multivesicular body protein 6 [Orussus abietinus]|uniref:charged multivesicular body protein 6 n=1 Tax=Orussus abietinus TaxID=222816 RepID=UPI000626BBE3|nr:charged multivesicular body protein 6 [Orussus abietinus]